MGAAAGGMLLFGGLTCFGRNGFAGGSANRRNRFGSGGNGNCCPELSSLQTETPEITGRLGHRGRLHGSISTATARYAVQAAPQWTVCLYLFDSSGTQLTGWQKIDDTWHYYDSATYAAAVGAPEDRRRDLSVRLHRRTKDRLAHGRRCAAILRPGDGKAGGTAGSATASTAIMSVRMPQQGDRRIHGGRCPLSAATSETGTQKLGLCNSSITTTVRYYDAER